MLHATTEQALRKAALKGTIRTLTVVGREAPIADSCTKCCVRGICLPSGVADRNASVLHDAVAHKWRVARGAALFRSGDAFEAIYAVRSGAFKNVGVSSKGEEKITGFYLPGEVLGLDAISSGEHPFNGVALEDSDVCVIPFAKLQELALRLPELQSYLFRLISGDISRDHGLLLLLGSMTAEQRLAAFLLSLSRRYKHMGFSAERFNLRMTREDIGNYLGLTLETVSRFLSRFQREGLIASHQREIELRNPDGLMEIVGCW